MRNETIKVSRVINFGNRIFNPRSTKFGTVFYFFYKTLKIYKNGPGGLRADIGILNRIPIKDKEMFHLKILFILYFKTNYFLSSKE
ncbi:hypothetical protein BH23THE1_BH23THE1_07950 [soil metagenome]